MRSYLHHHYDTEDNQDENLVVKEQLPQAVVTALERTRHPCRNVDKWNSVMW